MMSKKYIYHYSAQFQIKVGSVAYSDGVATCDYEINDYEGYLNLKENITIATDCEIEDPSKITITSLTLLSVKD